VSFSWLFAAEQQIQDVVASCVVGNTFGLTLDRTNLDFGLLKPGQRVELYPQGYYHQITCVSNNKKTWYLKLSIPANIAGPGGYILPKDNFKWQVFWTNGSGVKNEGWGVLQDNPAVVYTSGPMDSQGEEVYIQLRYALDVPGNIPTGNYNAVLVYTITESL